MTENKVGNTDLEETNAAGPFTIYTAGGLFTPDELATNTFLKEAIWRLSNGKFQLFLPQSREIQELDNPNIEAYIRNTDLLEVVKADIILARFDGLELESGTVVEFMTAKFLGKPTVLLRSDFRRVNFGNFCEPYNLMVKNWPRTVEVQINSFVLWAEVFDKVRNKLSDSDTIQGWLNAELDTAQKSIDEIAKLVIDGLEAVLKLKSPYPTEYQELVYHAFRHTPRRGFGELLTKGELDELIRRFRKNGTL